MAAKRGLWRSWKRSVIRRTAFVDGEVAVMWGLAPTAGMMALSAVPWMLTTPAVEKMPLAFLKEARLGVAEMLAIYPRLENAVLSSYQRAVRFLVLAGFEMGEPEPMPPHGVAYRRFWAER